MNSANRDARVKNCAKRYVGTLVVILGIGALTAVVESKAVSGSTSDPTRDGQYQCIERGGTADHGRYVTECPAQAPRPYVVLTGSMAPSTTLAGATGSTGPEPADAGNVAVAVSANPRFTG